VAHLVELIGRDTIGDRAMSSGLRLNRWRSPSFSPTRAVCQLSGVSAIDYNRPAGFRITTHKMRTNHLPGSGQRLSL
jgi:hypothetical protein